MQKNGSNGAAVTCLRRARCSDQFQLSQRATHSPVTDAAPGAQKRGSSRLHGRTRSPGAVDEQHALSAYNGPHTIRDGKSIGVGYARRVHRTGLDEDAADLVGATAGRVVANEARDVAGYAGVRSHTLHSSSWGAGPRQTSQMPGRVRGLCGSRRHD